MLTFYGVMLGDALKIFDFTTTKSRQFNFLKTCITKIFAEGSQIIIVCCSSLFRMKPQSFIDLEKEAPVNLLRQKLVLCVLFIKQLYKPYKTDVQMFDE